MRQDNQYIQERFVPFLKDIFRDVRKSEQSFYEFFDPDARRKEAFRDDDDIDQYLNGTESLFENAQEAESKSDLLVDTIFARMMKDFHDNNHYYYIPNKDGEFTSEQEEILFKLAQTLISKHNIKEEEFTKNQAGKVERTIAESSKRLTNIAGLRFTEGGELKFNPQSGLIEGAVRNDADPQGEVLTVRIDPENPEVIIFANAKGDMAFLMDNTNKSLGTFKDKDTQRSSVAVMLASGYVPTQNSVPNKKRAQTLAGQGGVGPVPKTTKQEEQVEEPEAGLVAGAESLPGTYDLAGLPTEGKEKAEKQTEEQAETIKRQARKPKGFLGSIPRIKKLMGSSPMGLSGTGAEGKASTGGKAQTGGKSPAGGQAPNQSRMTDQQERQQNRKGMPRGGETAGAPKQKKQKKKSTAGTLAKVLFGSAAGTIGGVAGGLSLDLF
jgi:hypothetical protein